MPNDNIWTTLSSSLVSSEFIEGILTAIAKTNDDRLLFLASKALENGFFDDPMIIQSEILRNLLKEVSSLRNRGADIVAVREIIAKNKERFKVFVDILDKKESHVTSDLFLNDIFLEKIKNQVVVKNLQSIGEILTNVSENTQTSELIDRLERILTNMLMEMNIQLDFREMSLGEIKKRMEIRKNRNKEDSKVRIPFGITPLDESLSQGIEKGRFVVLASSPGYGKSTIVASSAVEAVKRGFNAWIVTLENSLIETWARIDASITGISINDLDTMSDTVEKKLEEFYDDESNGELLVKEFPPDSMTITMLRNYVVQKISQGVKRPDIIFVDYLDIIKSEKQYAQLRFELAHICKNLKKFASDFDCVMVVPTQLNRGAVDKDGQSDGGLSNLAEAFAKSFEPDLLMVIRQNKREMKDGQFRIFVAKSRVSESRFEVVCDVDYSKMRIKGIRRQWPGDSDLSMIEDGEEMVFQSIDMALDHMNGNGKK